MKLKETNDKRIIINEVNVPETNDKWWKHMFF